MKSERKAGVGQVGRALLVTARSLVFTPTRKGKPEEGFEHRNDLA